MAINGIQEITQDIISLVVLLVVVESIVMGLTVALTEHGKKRTLLLKILSSISILITVFLWNKFVLNK